MKSRRRIDISRTSSHKKSGSIFGIQRAVDYVEEHITEELDYDEIARQSCSTGYPFQRVFGLLCGYTGSLPENRQIKDPAAFIKVPGNQNTRDLDSLPAK